MRRLLFVLLLAMFQAQADEGALQHAFERGMQAQQAGDIAGAEGIFRDLLKSTDSPRVKLELARVLYLQGKYDEAKALFKDVSVRSDTPWRVRDNIGLYVAQIEERTGYVKLGVTVVSDTNPGNLAAQKEFAIGDIQVTPAEAPKRVTGMRYSAQAWKPVETLRAAGYLTVAYIDYPAQELDRLTVDAGVAKNLTDSARLRGKAGVEFTTFGGKRLYQFPYLGLDAVLHESESYRLAGEMKLGKVLFTHVDYLDATFWSGALSLRRAFSPSASATLRGAVETSHAAEAPYSFTGWELAPGVSKVWPESAFVVGATVSFGTRTYGEVDPLFGQRREDTKTRVEISAGNRKWRWRDHNVSISASVEENQSNVGFYKYRKSSVVLVVE